MNKVITKIRSGIGGYLKDNILFLTFVFASVLNGFLLRAFTVKFNYSQINRSWLIWQLYCCLL